MLGDPDFQWNDLFKPEDEESVKKNKSEAKKRLNEVIEAGKTALSSPEFARYREKYEAAQASLINSMIIYTNEFFKNSNGDIAIYGANMARFMTKLGDLKSLLVSVQSDANKEKYNGEKE